MRSGWLASDYLERARRRLAAVDALVREESWPDVVRESQEVVELALKGLLRQIAVEPPRSHDVSDVLRDQREQVPAPLRAAVPKLCEISRNLRRDRELAFHGTEDLAPLEFYSKRDAEAARRNARWVVETVRAAFGLADEGSKRAKKRRP